MDLILSCVDNFEARMAINTVSTSTVIIHRAVIIHTVLCYFAYVAFESFLKFHPVSLRLVMNLVKSGWSLV